MKTKGIILALVLAVGVAVVVFGTKKQNIPQRGSTVGLEAPHLSLGDTSGKTLSLSDLRGSVVFVNFWASWCQPCKDEMPSVQALFNRFKDAPGFRMVTILYRDDPARARSFLSQNGFQLPVFLDPDGTSAAAYGVTGVPETYIVDKRGVLREKVIGPADWGSPQASSLIAGLLSE